MTGRESVLHGLMQLFLQLIVHGPNLIQAVAQLSN